MRNGTLKNTLFTFVLSVCFLLNTTGQVKKPDGVNPKSAGVPYETAKNDPLNSRIYTLKNGLKVYMTVYKDAPRIQTYIAVKAGSKNDPKDATGLAHYLEHMVFKGTDKFGTKDFAKEEAEIKKIEELYEVYRKTKDVAERKKIYHRIDSISGVAAKYAIANEYDKMAAALGIQGSNAYTSFEQTVYVGDVPSNQLENWLTLESERFRKPVLRLFHTELEAVYEEKNRSLDNDGSKVWEALFSGLFQNHNYGLQTTIGTIDHLKNPSMKEINKYYQKYYVPNNMAICMSGDFDPDQAIKLIDKKFGGMSKKGVEPFKFVPEKPISGPVVKEVVGPDAENVIAAFRFGGVGTRDADMIKLISLILSNGKAGLLDLNLNQSQKVLSAQSFDYALKDYSIHGLAGEAKEGQKLEDVADLILQQIELVKKGEFPDWLLPAIITDLKYQQTKQFENNRNRASEMVAAFTTGEKWQDHIDQIDRLSKITKQEVIDFAKKNYGKNYVVVYKRNGESPAIEKVEKPEITPVELNHEDQSPFMKSVVEKAPAEVAPVFIDFEKDIQKFTIKPGIPVRYTKNTENKTFDLYYVFDMGSNNDKMLPLAIDYLPYLGTSKYSPAEIQQEFYKLGCNFGVFNSTDQVYVSLNGLSDNFDKAVALFESLLNDPKPEAEALQNLIMDKLKRREDDKLSKSLILRTAMVNYGMYGPKNPFTSVLSEDEIKKVKPEELIEKIKGLESFEHRVLYYGTKSTDELKTTLDNLHRVPAVLRSVPKEEQFRELETGNTVYVVDYDMKQAEIIMLAKGAGYDPSRLPEISLYNEYFGGGMSSVVFQELRESRALAYSVNSRYREPGKKEKSYYLSSYIGSQADKLPEAMKGMSELLNDMPKSEIMFNSAKESILSSLRTDRITRSNILFTYERAQKMGLTYDVRKDLFSKIPSMNFEDIKKFQDNNVKNKPTTVLVLGKKENLDMKTLEKYGKVQFLTLKEVFGY
ncbi:MAG: M16 family metallopeptidase [Bacteroidia bacterium]